MGVFSAAVLFIAAIALIVMAVLMAVYDTETNPIHQGSRKGQPRGRHKK